MQERMQKNFQGRGRKKDGKYLAPPEIFSPPGYVGLAMTLCPMPKDTTSELAGLSSHYPFLTLNVKQGSCEYQLSKPFGLTRPENLTHV